MRTLLSALLLAAFLPAVLAQDLEPTRSRAADRIAGELSEHLLMQSSPRNHVRLIPRYGVAPTVGEAMTNALQRQGYRVFESHEGRDSSYVLELRVWSESAERNVERLVLETIEARPTRFECLHGDATWADVTPGDGHLLVEGPLRSESKAARKLARQKAERRLLWSAGWDGLEPISRSELGRIRFREFVAREQEGEALFHRAYFGLDAAAKKKTVSRLRNALEDERRSRARAPWIRSGITAALGVLLLATFLKLDLRTRGYRTGRLRWVFGILFLLGAGLCWRIPL